MGNAIRTLYFSRRYRRSIHCKISSRVILFFSVVRGRGVTLTSDGQPQMWWRVSRRWLPTPPDNPTSCECSNLQTRINATSKNRIPYFRPHGPTFNSRSFTPPISWGITDKHPNLPARYLERSSDCGINTEDGEFKVSSSNPPLTSLLNTSPPQPSPRSPTTAATSCQTRQRSSCPLSSFRPLQ